MSINHSITRLRNALGLKVSYGLRAFAIYFVILGSLSWFILDQAVDRLNIGMRQSAENVMVDAVNLLSGLLETQIKDSETIDKTNAIDTDLITEVLARTKSKQLLAQIYRIDKVAVGSNIYITDANGRVIYDSTGRDVGKDYSQWRDVLLTLRGEYGARTSFIDLGRKKTVAKEMVVAAPIKLGNEIIGVVSLATPIAGLELHLATETRYMQNTMYKALALALFFGFLLSLLFSRSINKIAHYADKMASGETVETPSLLDQRLADLAESVANLRQQLDGKKYVENYIHSLTHELKTPITGIQGAVELIKEGLPPEEQERFIENIGNSNNRMARLVDRMLNLAKLESQTQVVRATEFNLTPTLQRLIDERQTILECKGLKIKLDCRDAVKSQGDAMLLSQAIGNLLDNAISFADEGSDLEIKATTHGQQTRLSVKNKGELIPDYALTRIYERFFSLPSKVDAKQARKSTGLGLSFVKEIMKLHKGQVVIANGVNGVTAELVWPSE